MTVSDADSSRRSQARALCASGRTVALDRISKAAAKGEDKAGVAEDALIQLVERLLRKLCN
jgi:hypothetical protein